MVVQHNLQAMNANRMLNVTTQSQAKSTEKLSSGYKINRAADDAAGLSISEKMRKQIRGLDQASTNAEDGVSAVQTAEGALTEVHSMLQRMNELAVQAANGTNSESDRDAIQAEINQLTTEIDRVAETTKFNETYLLKGTNGTIKNYMKGHDGGLKGELIDGSTTATFTMNLEKGSTVTIGGQTFNILRTSAKEKNDGLISTEEDSLTKVQNTLKDIATKGATVTVNGTVYTMIETKDASGVTTKVFDAGTGSTYTPAQMSEMVADGTELMYKGLNGDKAFKVRDYTQTNNITFDEAVEKVRTALVQANNLGVTDGHYSKIDPTKDVTTTNEKEVKFIINKGYAEIKDTLSFNLHVGADADMTNKIQVDIDSMSAAGLGIYGLNVSDDSGMAATYAIDAIADALQRVSDQRSALGAVQNRLEHTINNLDNVVENTTAAESRIRDTDMAEQMVEQSKNSILAQAGQSMLAQANQATQGVMSLLQ